MNRFKIAIFIFILSIYVAVATLCFVVFNIVMSDPLLGFVFGTIAAACLVCLFKDAIPDIDFVPKPIVGIMMFIGLIMMFPVAMALSLLILPLMLSFYLLSRLGILTPPNPSGLERPYNPESNPKRFKSPQEFIEEIRRRSGGI